MRLHRPPETRRGWISIEYIASILVATASTVKRSSKSTTPPRRSDSATWSSSKSGQPVGEPAGSRRDQQGVVTVRTMPWTPVTSVHTTGHRIAIASMAAPDMPSYSDEMARTSAAHRRSGMSWRCPSKLVTAAARGWSASAASSAGVALPGFPAMNTRSWGTRSTIVSTAAMRSVWRFWCSWRPTASTTLEVSATPN